MGYKIPVTKLNKLGVLQIDEAAHSPREAELRALSELFSSACIVGKWSADAVQVFAYIYYVYYIFKLAKINEHAFPLHIVNHTHPDTVTLYREINLNNFTSHLVTINKFSI